MLSSEIQHFKVCLKLYVIFNVMFQLICIFDMNEKWKLSTLHNWPVHQKLISTIDKSMKK